MAGHSKWANIKHRKAAQDKKRGKVFTKIIREITVAAQKSGDEESPMVKNVVAKALAANMTRDTIDRAIKRGLGDGEKLNLTEIRYEGYGPSGVAIMVDCLTDNHKRTIAEVRYAFSRNGGSVGTDGSVSFMFNKIGQIIFAPGCNEDAVTEAAIDAGVEDVVAGDDGSIEIITTPDDMLTVKEALDTAGFAADNAEVIMQADTNVELSGEDAEKYNKLVDALEDLDDVQDVHSNVILSD